MLLFNPVSKLLLVVRPVLAAQALLDVKDDVSRSRLHSLKRTRDIMSATEGRIAALKAELAESEHHVVGLSNGEVCLDSAFNYHVSRAT